MSNLTIGDRVVRNGSTGYANPEPGTILSFCPKKCRALVQWDNYGAKPSYRTWYSVNRLIVL